MPYFRCNVISHAGKKTTIIKEAASESELASTFNEGDYILIKYTQVSETSLLRAKKHFNRNIILEFTEIMTSLLNSGLTIQDAIALCCNITNNSKTEWLCKSILKALQNGLPLHEALKMHTPSFPSLYQSLVKLGEQTGSVATVFKRLGNYLRNEKKIRGKVGTVIWYPILVLFLAFAGSIAMIVFLFPRMTEIFEAFMIGSDQSMAVELTNIYRSMWMSFSFFAFIIFSVITVFLLKRHSKRFAYLFDYLLLNMPFLGNFIKSIHTMDFAFAMEMLTGAGINVHKALIETAAIIRNKAYSKALMEVHSKLIKGESLSAAFGHYKEFPLYIATWIAVGEKTGAVEPVFTQIREYFQSDVERISEKMMNMLEPCLILIVGLIVMFMILQFILPLFSLYGRLI